MLVVDTRSRTVGRTLAALTMLVALAATSGCGGGDDETVTPRERGSQTGATVDTDLTITTTDAAGKSETWRLTCDAAGTPGGTHPDPTAACAALTAKGETALPPVAPDQMCTQIYGGPQKATITGTWRGKAVTATFSRTNGCEISRWTALEGLLPKASGASAR
jgi:Subtilisin inhibitor-like